MKSCLAKQSIISAAEAGGKELKKLFNHSGKEIIKNKNYYDVVSKADFESEKAILKVLKNKLPTVNILSEEEGFIDQGSNDTIVVDPLDGSSNFLLGIPHFSVSIVYIQQREIVASVVYNPILNKVYFAEKGKGAFLNGKRLKVKKDSKLPYVTVNFNHKDQWEDKRKFFDRLYRLNTKRVLNNWSPNLDFCLLAEGKVDSVISKGSLIYDYAPGFLIAKESGCFEFPKVKKVEPRGDSVMSFVISNKISLSQKMFGLIL